MSDFAKKIFDIFEQLQTKYCFVPSKTCADSRFASLLRFETQDVFTYVFVRDGRTGNANVDVHLWIAPPELPDDSLDKLGVGYKVLMGSEYDVNDEFFLSCEKRVINFLQCTTAIIPVIRLEMQKPSIVTKRWKIYQIEQSVLRAVLKLICDGQKDALQVLEQARQMAKKGGKLSRLSRDCEGLVAQIINCDLLSSDALDFFQHRESWIADTIATTIFTHLLGELSRSKSV